MRPGSIARMSLIVLITIFASSALGGCCCYVDRPITRSPEVDVRVVDEQTGEPIEGARVQLCRVKIGPSPNLIVDAWEQETNSDGRASFEYVGGEETIAPFMMHGVPQRAWELCASDESKRIVRSNRDGNYLLVEKAGVDIDKTPHELPEQTLELSGEVTESADCLCNSLQTRQQWLDTGASPKAD